jgi:hypothetical protein
MPKTIDPNQVQKIDRHYNRPIYLVHIKIFDQIDLYFSDRNFTFNGINYEDYLFSLSNIENEVRNLGGYDNQVVTFRFKNQKFRYKDYLSEFFDDNPPEDAVIEIHKLLTEANETFGSDVSTKIFKGNLGQIYGLSEIEFKIDAHFMLFALDDKLPLDVIDKDDFPGADPDDVGKYRNIVIGNCKKVICRWTDAGWASSLTADITASQTSINVSDATGAPYASFTAICDQEQIGIQSKSGNDFTVTRGYGGTTAAAHNRGSLLYEKKSDFEAEVSHHPVKSIGDIFVDRRGEWVRLISGFTKYENSEGRAYIRLTDKTKFEEKVNISVDVTTDPYEGNHLHDIPAGVFSSKQCVPDGSSGADGHENVIDGNTGSYCAIDPDEGVQARFDGEVNLGTIARQQIWIYKIDTAVTGYVQCPVGTNLQTLPAQVGWYRIIKTGGNWQNDVCVFGGASGNQIAEIYKIVEYSPAASVTEEHPATDIDVDVGVTLSGNSVANILLGDAVACDVEGFQDDASGTYTGTANALIERPDHVRKLILMGLLGISSDDIDASFASVGATYASRISGGYKFGFVLHEVATKSMDLFRQFDLQSRSNMFENQGKFKLTFGLTTEPISQMTFNKDNIKGVFNFGKTDIVDVKNRFIGHYFRDYSKSGSLGNEYQGVLEKSAGLADLLEEIAFTCIGDLPAMVGDVLDWILHERKNPKKKINFEAFWDSMILENCDYFMVISNLWSGLKFRLLKLIERPQDQIIEIYGEQHVPPDPSTRLLLHFDGEDGNMGPYIDEMGRPLTGHDIDPAHGPFLRDDQKKFGATSINLVNSNWNFISTPGNSGFDIGRSELGKFCIDFWVYFNTLPSSPASYLFASYWKSEYEDPSWAFRVWNSSGTYKLVFENLNKESDYNISIQKSIPSGLVTEQWYHIALCVDKVGESWVYRFFMDGVKIGEETINVAIKDPRGLFCIGGYFSGWWLGAYMDEFRFSIGVPRWIADFTPPTEPYTPD